MSVTISTDGLPVSERRDYWQSILSDVLAPCEMIYGEGEFFARLVTGQIGGVRVVRITASQYEQVRTPRLIRRSDPETYRFTLFVRGRVVQSQGERVAMLGQGDLSITDHSRPYRFVGEAGRELVSMEFPRTLLPL